MSNEFGSRGAAPADASSDDPRRSNSFSDHDLSVSTQVFLRQLGVTTVGDFLDLPEVRLPALSQRAAQLIWSELEAVLTEHGVRYQGAVVFPTERDVDESAMRRDAKGRAFDDAIKRIRGETEPKR